MMRTCLEFLKDQESVYLAGLDNKAYPLTDYSSRFQPSLKEKLRLIKLLSLLTDNIAIPPTFIADLIKSDEDFEQFNRNLTELFESRHLLTSVYETMGNTIDFLDYKIEKGSPSEIQMFKIYRSSIAKTYKRIPLYHRYVNKMSSSYKELLFAAIQDAFIKSKNSEYLEILSSVESKVSSDLIVLSRETFISTLNSLLRQKNISNFTYRKAYYLMNYAYYKSGAETYFSNISLFNSVDYSWLPANLFTADKNSIKVGYDPTIFLKVLKLFGITEADIDDLQPEDIDRIKSHKTFLKFKKNYLIFINHVQSTESRLKKKLSKNQLKKIEEEIFHTIASKYIKGSKRISNENEIATNQQDFLWNTILLGLAAFFNGIWLSFLAFVPIAIKLFGIKPSDRFVRAIERKQEPFKGYVDFLVGELERVSADR